MNENTKVILMIRYLIIHLFDFTDTETQHSAECHPLPAL